VNKNNFSGVSNGSVAITLDFYLGNPGLHPRPGEKMKATPSLKQ